MAEEYLANKADLTAVANAIRSKGNTTSQLTFPSGFISAINNISAAPTATLNVALAMANGNQVIDAEKYKTVTITKPDTMVPENIKKDIDIGGVTGTLSGMQDISTEAAMDALLVAANIGNAYRFTGDTTSKYIKGDVYVVEDGE